MATIELLIFGGIALFVGIMSLLHLMESMSAVWFEKRVPLFTLIMLSLIVGALLLESHHTRRKELEQLEKNTQQIEMLLAKYDEKYQSGILGGQYLTGVDKVHQSGLELFRTAQQRIRVFLVVGGPRPPAKYFEAYAMALAESKQKGISVGIDVIYAFDFENIPEDFFDIVESDRDVYSKHGVRHLAHTYVIDMNNPYGFSILTVDRKHAQISFPPLEDIEALERTMKFFDQERLVTDLVSWFDKQLVPAAVPLGDWMQAYARPSQSETTQKPGR